MYSCSAAEAFLCSAPARGFSNPGASQGSIIWILYNLQSKLASEVSVWGAEKGQIRNAKTCPNFIPHIVKYLCESCFDSSCFSAQNRSRLWPTQKFGCDYSVYRRLRLRNTFTILSLCVYVCFFLSIKNLFFGLCFQLCLCFLYFLSIGERFFFASVFFPLSFFSAVDLCVFHFLIFLPYFLFLIFSPLFTLFCPT